MSFRRDRAIRPGTVRGITAVIAILFGVALAAPLVAAQGQATLTPPHTDSGVDTDGDLLFNFLTVSVSLDATVAGSFMVAVDLWDSTNTTYITAGAAFASLSGPSIVPVDLNGLDIRNSGIDGPYTALIAVYDDTFNVDDSGNHTTGAYLATDFDLPPALFAPPHSDAAIDTDADTLDNVLRVTAIVNVSDAGAFDVSGTLFDSFFFPIDTASTQMFLSPGSGQTIDLDFEGWKIRANGVDGPYFVDLFLSDAFTFVTLDTGFHTTGAYLSNQFDLPPASLSPPHADSGVDTDGDTLFNRLEIDVHVQVDSPGDYFVQINLWDEFRTAFLTSDYAFLNFAVGTQTVTVSLSTIPMVVAGVPGPYLADIVLYNDLGDIVDQDTHTTQAYTLNQFDPAPAAFAPPHSDQGVDRDVPPDGRYNILSVEASINVVESGVFSVYGNLWDGAMTTQIGFEQALVSLSPGTQVVPLNFSGVLIRNSGFDGPFAVELYLDTFDEGTAISLDTDLHATGSYLSLQFQSVTPAALSGTVRDSVTLTPIDFGSVLAFDFLNNFAVYGSTDSLGYYALPLYNGDWVVTYDSFFNDGVLRRQRLVGDTIVDVDLLPSSPSRLLGNFTHGPWDTVDLELIETFPEDAQLFRIQFDWQLGNRDQVLSQAEWDTLIALYGFGLPPSPTDTEDLLEIDLVPFTLVPGTGSSAFLNVPGPIDSSTAPSLLVRGTFTNGTVGPAATHTIDLNVSYDQPFLEVSYNAVLPAGYVLQSYTAPPEVTVTGVGTATVRVDPGVDPDPFDLNTSVWIRLVANTPDATDPVVVAVSANPDPVVTGNTVTVAATVTDDVGVARARLQAWDPAGGLSLDVQMTDVGGDRWEHTFAPAATGLWTFTVTGEDFAGNTAGRNGQFRVIELNPPSVTGLIASPNPQEYAQPVLFAATVSDDTAVGTVSVEVRDPGGAFRGNFTMAYNAASGRYETTQVVGTPGTNAFRVWASDTSGNWASAAGTFVVQDTTAPVLTGAGAAPDPLEVGSVVTVSAVASDMTGVTSVTVAIRDSSDVLVGTFAMTGTGGLYTYDYTPTEIGTYSFTIVASDAYANTATVSGAFDVQDTTNPVASAGPDQTVRTGQAVAFDGSGSTDNHQIANYTWTFTEGGQTKTLFGDAPSHAFTSAGTYEVTLRVTDASGNWAEDTVRITVSAAPGGSPGIPSFVWIVTLALILGVVAAALFLRRRKSATAPPGASPPEAPSPAVGPPPTSSVVPPTEPEQPPPPRA